MSTTKPPTRAEAGCVSPVCERQYFIRECEPIPASVVSFNEQSRGGSFSPPFRPATRKGKHGSPFAVLVFVYVGSNVEDVTLLHFHAARLSTADAILSADSAKASALYPFSSVTFRSCA